jgi:molybdopterin-guanine dinucleotide biosynthesis protein A
MAVNDPVPVLVLAGGASRRMGTDKRSALIDGVPMLVRTLRRLAPASCLVVVDPRDPPRIPLPGHAQVVFDTRPGQGPLAAIEAGLGSTTAPIALVVGGDMPWVEPAVLALLADRLATTEFDVACLADPHGPRPLPLALRREHALPRIASLLDSGERRVRALLRGALAIQPSIWLPLDPVGASLRDVDTPADLAATR